MKRLLSGNVVRNMCAYGVKVEKVKVNDENRCGFVKDNFRLVIPTYEYASVVGMLPAFPVLVDATGLIRQAVAPVRFDASNVEYFCLYRENKGGVETYYAIDPLNANEKYSHIHVRAEWDLADGVDGVDVDCLAQKTDATMLAVTDTACEFLLPLSDALRVGIATGYRRTLWLLTGGGEAVYHEPKQQIVGMSENAAQCFESIARAFSSFAQTLDEAKVKTLRKIEAMLTRPVPRTEPTELERGKAIRFLYENGMPF